MFVLFAPQNHYPWVVLCEHFKWNFKMIMRSTYSRLILYYYSGILCQTSRNQNDDIFTIHNPAFAEHICASDIYPREFQFNKANTSDVNIKVIGNNIHTSVYDKRDDFGFPIVNFPWLSGDVPRILSNDIYISQLVRFARCCTSVFDFQSKKSSNY